MTDYPVTHVTIRDNPPAWLQQKQVIGIMRDISPRREDEDVEDNRNILCVGNEDPEDETQLAAKVVNPRRRPRRPKPSEVAETK